MNWRGVYDFLMARLAERSTWTGFIALATAAGITIAPDIADKLGAAGAAIAGLVLVLTKEKPPVKVTVSPQITITTEEPK